MKVILTFEAFSDLNGIRYFLKPLNPYAAKRVIHAINRTINLIRNNPRIGHPVTGTEIRELIETRYGYRIPYWVADNEVRILRIYHPSREPLEYDKLRHASDNKP